MKKLLVASIILAGSVVNAQTAQSTDTQNAADASNSGLVFNTTNSGKNVQYPPPVSPGFLPSSTGCVLSNTTSASIGWNAVSVSTSNQIIAKHCLTYEAIRTALALCQFKTANQLYNAYIQDQFKIEIDADLTITNRPINSCNKQESATTIVPTAVVQPQPIINVNVEVDQCPNNVSVTPHSPRLQLHSSPKQCK